MGQTFADESVLATCMVYLEGWKTFTSPEQLKRIVSLMHRMAVKAHSDGLFFKVPPSLLASMRAGLTIVPADGAGALSPHPRRS